MRVMHGASKHPLYSVWRAMIARCHNPKHPRYSGWGGRGIKVCASWRRDVWTFIAWGEANGWKRGLEIDRCNNGGDYKPLNCRFVTNRDQANNRRPRQLTPEGVKAISASIIASNKRRYRTPEGREQALKNLRSKHG